MSDRAFAVTVPADARYLKVVRAFFKPLMEEHFGEEGAGMIILALDESCSNIVKHRSQLDGGLIHVRVLVMPDRLRLRIGDFCRDTDVDNIRPRDLTDVRPGGLGTHFINQIMDRVAFEPEPARPGRMALVMDKALPSGKEKDGDAHRDQHPG
jgi:sigma-B regulation protein RsbU (phosphoserine phosphatase)